MAWLSKLKTEIFVIFCLLLCTVIWYIVNSSCLYLVLRWFVEQKQLKLTTMVELGPKTITAQKSLKFNSYSVFINSSDCYKLHSSANTWAGLVPRSPSRLIIVNKSKFCLNFQVEMVEMDYQDLLVHLGNQALPVSLLCNWLNVKVCHLCSDYNKVCSASLDNKTLWPQSRLCRDNKYEKKKINSTTITITRFSIY